MLTKAEYNEIMTRKRSLEQTMEAVKEEGDIAQEKVTQCANELSKLQDRMMLYTNHLAADIEEYEDAHPTEPIEP